MDAVFVFNVAQVHFVGASTYKDGRETKLECICLFQVIWILCNDGKKKDKGLSPTIITKNVTDITKYYCQCTIVMGTNECGTV